MPVNYTIWNETGYKPFDEQIDFHSSKARFKIPACGRRFGKSRMAAAEVEPYLFNVNMRGVGWIVAPTFDNADEFQYLWDDIVLRMGWGKKIKKANNSRTGEMYIEMPWGAKAVVKSARHPETLVGKGLRWCILSEAAKLPRFIFVKLIRPALADYRAPCIMPSTPEGRNWYKKEHDKGRSPKYTEYQSWNFPAWKNPHVYPGGFDDPEIQSQDPSEDNAFFWQEIGADFRTLTGLVYPEFDPNIHVRESRYRSDLPSFLWFDFGYSNPFVALDVQITPSDEVIIWREYYLAGKPVHIHARELRDRPQPEGYKVECGYGDSADPDAVETLSSILTPVIAQDEAKDVIKGLREVKKFLKDENGARIFIDPSCENTIREFEAYQMKDAKNALSIYQEDPKDVPLKKDDHAMDAIRYGIMHHFVLGAGMHLTDSVEDEDDREEEDSTFFTRAESDNFRMGAVL